MRKLGKKKFYAVARGRKPGIYRQWFGGNGAEAQVRGFPNALFKGFVSLESAETFLEDPKYNQPKTKTKAMHCRVICTDLCPSFEKKSNEEESKWTTLYHLNGI